MSEPANDERLLAVAGSISDGMDVDWTELRQQFKDSEATAIVDELRVLHGLATVRFETSNWDPIHVFNPIGRGSFATVYRAFDTELQREIALKVTLPQPLDGFDPQRAVREARLLARVRHPNVVTVFSAQRKGEAVAIAMELVKGSTLDELVRRNGPFGARETTLIGLDVCRALAAVHEAGLIHGDIKAHNVMREEGGRIVLMDFGTGKDLSAPAPYAEEFAGTPLYLAPEIFAGRPRTRTSDVYSLGILLFYLSTGTYPVDGDTRTEVRHRHLEPGARRRLRDVRPDLPAPFVAAVERATAEDPVQRFQTAGELEAALLASLGDQIEPRRSTRAGVVVAISAAALAGAVLLAMVSRFAGNDERVLANRSERASGPAAAADWPPAGTAGSNIVYRVHGAMYRARGGNPAKLRPGDRLTPGDELFLEIESSAPTYVYVVNEDDAGNSLLLYPLPGQRHEAVPAGRAHRLPGTVGGSETYWQVTSPGVREHFIIFFSPARLPELEQLLTSLPAPRRGAPVSYAPLPPATLDTLRSVGGLVTAPNASVNRQRLSERYRTPLAESPEQARGLVVRQIAFDNPPRTVP